METTRTPSRIASRRRRWIGTLGLSCALGMLSLPASVGAQAAPTPPAPDTTVAGDRGVSPRGAFIRAALIPGWGHASIGSYKRAAFYFVTEGATAWSLVKTRRRFAEAQERVLFREGVIRADLADEGITDAVITQQRLDDDEVLQDLLGLEESRRQQREDWTALGIFLLFLSGADAYVSAHLKDFPVQVEVNVQPVGNGRMELSVGLRRPN